MKQYMKQYMKQLRRMVIGMIVLAAAVIAGTGLVYAAGPIKIMPWTQWLGDDEQNSHSPGNGRLMRNGRLVPLFPILKNAVFWPKFTEQPLTAWSGQNLWKALE